MADEEEGKEQASFTERLSDEQRKSIKEQTAGLGSKLHDEWREPRKKEDGTYESRVKVLVKTEEGKEKWFNEEKVPSNSTEIRRQDIANTDYENLDPAWQEDNRAAAEVAVNLVWEAKTSGKELDDSFIEEASSAVHEKWKERNPWEEKLQVPYSELPEDEKEKDRAQVRKAIEISQGQSQDNKTENLDFHNSTHIGNSMLKKDEQSETPPPGVNPKDWGSGLRPLTEEERRYGGFGPDDMTKR